MQKGPESDFKCNDFAKCQDEEENERDFVIIFFFGNDIRRAETLIIFCNFFLLTCDLDSFLC